MTSTDPSSTSPCGHTFLRRVAEDRLLLTDGEVEFPPPEKIRVAASEDGTMVATFFPRQAWNSRTLYGERGTFYLTKLTGTPKVRPTPGTEAEWELPMQVHVQTYVWNVTLKPGDAVKGRTAKLFHADIGYVNVQGVDYLLVIFAEDLHANVLFPHGQCDTNTHPAANTKVKLLEPEFMCTTMATCGNKVAMVVHREDGKLDKAHGHFTLETVTVDIVQLSTVPRGEAPGVLLRATPFRRVCSVEGPRCWRKHSYTCLAFRPDGEALVFGCPAGGIDLYTDTESGVARDYAASPPHGVLPPPTKCFEPTGVVPTAVCFWRGRLVVAGEWGPITCARCTRDTRVFCTEDPSTGILLVDIGAYDVCASPITGLAGVVMKPYGRHMFYSNPERILAFFLSLNCIAQDLMSARRVAWMGAVVRGGRFRRFKRDISVGVHAHNGLAPPRRSKSRRKT